jgi:hypothetical protein
MRVIYHPEFANDIRRFEAEHSLTFLGEGGSHL